MPLTPPPPRSMVTRFGDWLRVKFLAGLFVTLPIALTAWILHFIYGLINGPFDQVVRALVARNAVPMSDYFTRNHDGTIPGAGFVLTLALFLLVGILIGNFLGTQFLRLIDFVLLRIPLVKLIYLALKQAVEAVQGLGSDGGAPKFSSVVQVRIPGSDATLLGFVTNRIARPDGSATCHVFLPNAPSIFTGFVLIMEEDKLVPAGISVEEATKVILSMGLVTPLSKSYPIAPHHEQATRG